MYKVKQLIVCTLSILMLFGLVTTGSAQSELDFYQTANTTDYLTAGFTPDPYTIDITSGGSINVSYLGDDCRGYATASPDFSLHWDGDSSFLRFYVESTRDTTLIINGPNGNWFCDDDSYGTNPSLDFNSPREGRYDVWIGSYSEGTYHPSTLNITELNSRRTLIVEESNHLDSLLAGFTPDPYSVDITSGGSINVSYLGDDCRGYAATSPDFSLHWDGDSSFLRFYVESTRDTTLIINGPNGNWFCDDDSYGTNPSLDFNSPREGRYDVWIGSYSEGTYHPSTLNITELTGQFPR